MTARNRIGVLVSGHGSNMMAIVEACESGRIPAEVAFVGADRLGTGATLWAKGRGIRTFEVNYRGIRRSFREGRLKRQFRKEMDEELLRLHGRGLAHLLPRRYGDAMCLLAPEIQLVRWVECYDIDLLCLAGFMRLLTPYAIDRLSPDPDRPRIMNIHPALLPSFPGTDGYGDTFRYGCRVAGCTVHYVDYGEDTGPIIGQRSFAVEPGDSEDDVCRKGLALEHELYPECVGLHVAGRLALRHVSQRDGTRRLCVFMS